jgi:peptidoglycan hydrolase-like protein with peptidoglycan-binding domain
MLPGHTRLFFCGFAVVACAVTVNALRQPSRSGPVIAVATTVPAQVLPRVETLAKAEVSAKAAASKSGVAVPAPAVAVAATVVAPSPAPVPPPAASAPVAAPISVIAPITIATVGEPVRVPTRLPGAPVVGQAHLPSVMDGDTDVIRALQKELVNAGYGPLAVNGNAGHLTRAAIMGYEHDHAMPLTGEASERLLKRIRAGEAPRKADDQATRRIATQEAEHVVLIVQKSLEALGHNPGRIDGRLGDETLAAIKAFEAEAKMKPVGRVSADLFSQLARSVGAKSANR